MTPIAYPWQAFGFALFAAAFAFVSVESYLGAELVSHVGTKRQVLYITYASAVASAASASLSFLFLFLKKRAPDEV